MQPHDLHHHLVGIGRAVERAGPGTVIGFGLRLQQGGAVDLALGEELPDLGLLVVGEPGGHRPGRDEDGRQVTEGQRPDDQARHDLVADAEIYGGIEGLMRQGDSGRERDHLAREQRQFHAGFALRDAIAHGRHAARHLGHASRLAGRTADHLGIGLVGLVGRQHVVVSRDDREVGARAVAQHGLVTDPAGREAVGLVGATEPCATRAGFRRRSDPVEIAPPAIMAAVHDPLRDFAEAGVERG